MLHPQLQKLYAGRRKLMQTVETPLKGSEWPGIPDEFQEEHATWAELSD